MKLILASNSPRRKDILLAAGYDFSVVKSNFEEITDIKDPIERARYFAEQKAEEVFSRLSGDVVVVGADTLVFIGDNILGKPKDAADAYNTLKFLSGKTHNVVTGYAVITKDKKIISDEVTEVTFSDLPDELIKTYVQSGLPLDKAGSYGIQDGFPLVKSYRGSFNNIVGLPMEAIDKIIKPLLK